MGKKFSAGEGFKGFWKPVVEGEELSIVFQKFDKIAGVFGIQDVIRGFDTETGEQVIVPLRGNLTRITDEQLRSGDVIAFRYRGKVKTNKGREVYRFDYKVYPREDTEVREVLEELNLTYLLREDD